MDTPKDYVEFYQNCRPFIIGTIRRMGVPLRQWEVEDFADVLLNEFVACDYLNREVDYAFNPEYSYTDSNGNTRYAQFSTYLYRFISNRVRNFQSKWNRRTKMKDVHGVYETDDGPMEAVQIEAAPSPYAEPDFVEVIKKIRVELSHIGVRQGAKRDMEALFMAIVRDILNDGFVDNKRLCEVFEISRGSLSLWLKDLRHCPSIKLLT